MASKWRCLSRYCSTIVKVVLNSCSVAQGPAGANGVEVATHNGTSVLTLCGELDLTLATMVRAQLRPLAGDITLDCAGLTFMDAAGINLFLEIDQHCVARGAKLTVVSAPRCVTRMLTLTQLDGAFDVRSQDPVA